MEKVPYVSPHVMPTYPAVTSPVVATQPIVPSPVMTQPIVNPQMFGGCPTFPSFGFHQNCCFPMMNPCHVPFINPCCMPMFDPCCHPISGLGPGPGFLPYY
ncbi:hypothetical protein ACFSO7_07890 [Bacillus sp. CGMCC 1.16607]|uniref:hypothetical protein n=1 Tax=Bacillus sp. CGMCC 1.16607 TaxID=3351842 RepID=UPI0036318ECF